MTMRCSPRCLGVTIRGCVRHVPSLVSARTCSTPTAGSYDAVIVGGGVMGSAIAFELSKSGWRTLNVDQGAAAGLGSTSASCGIIRTMYSLLDSVKLAHEGYHLWTRWADHIGGVDEIGPAPFTEVPTVIPKCKSSNNFLKNGLPPHATLGIPYEEIDNAELQSRFPWMDVNSYGPPVPMSSPRFGEPTGLLDGAVVTGATGYVSDTVLATHNLQRAAEAQGGAFRFRVAVTSILKSQGRVSGVQLSDGCTISAPVVVNACGPWSAEFNRLAFAGDAPADDSRVRTRPMRVEVAYPPAPPALTEHNGCWMGDFDTGVYIRPATGGRICIGSVEPECDSQHDLKSTAEFEDYLSEHWERQVYRAAQRIPTLPLPNTAQGVSHMYDKSDDFVPIYDKTALPGLYTAIGTSGNQFKNCGVVGQLMAHLIEACENGHDHDSNPVQFKLAITEEVLNMRTFSRLRQQEETSQGVLG